jgi:hypothetical protein
MNDFGKLPNKMGTFGHYCTLLQPREAVFNPILQNNLFRGKQLNLPYLSGATFGPGNDKVLRGGAAGNLLPQTWIAIWWLTTCVRFPPEK